MRELEFEKVEDEVGIEHPSHPNHRLFMYDFGIIKGTQGFCSTKCYACSVYLDDVAYTCTQADCSFSLHKQCAELPVQFHSPFHLDHPLTLLTQPLYPSNKFICNVCLEPRTGFTYNCRICDFDIDVTCSKHDPRVMVGDDVSKWFLQSFLHQHPLLPTIQDEHFDGKCTACMEPIHGLSYVCKYASCMFYLHISCAQLDKQIQHPFHPQHPLVLADPIQTIPDTRCIACAYTFRALAYRCTDRYCRFNLHIPCSQLTPVVKHYRHEHLLIFFEELNPEHDIGEALLCHNNKCVTCNNKCITCDNKCVTQVYRCVQCNFNIHSGCVSLPDIIKSKNHPHPLTLLSKYVDEDGDYVGGYYCDDFECEQERNPEEGVYFCSTCSYAIHIDCALAKAEYTVPEIVSTFKSKISELGDSKDTIQENEGQNKDADIAVASSSTIQEIKEEEEENSKTKKVAGDAIAEIAKIRGELEALTTKVMTEVGTAIRKLSELEAKYAKLI